MELTISEQKENALLQRKEVLAHLSFDKVTPSNKDVAKALADKLSSSEDAVVVKRISGDFGTTRATVKAYVYATKEQKEKIEPKIKVKKAEGAPAAPAK